MDQIIQATKEETVDDQFKIVRYTKYGVEDTAVRKNKDQDIWIFSEKKVPIAYFTSHGNWITCSDFTEITEDVQIKQDIELKFYQFFDRLNINAIVYNYKYFTSIC